MPAVGRVKDEVKVLKDFLKMLLKKCKIKLLFSLTIYTFLQQAITANHIVY